MLGQRPSLNRVIVRLVGGLGNQLFQYATARAIANRNGSELLLDIRETEDCSGKWRYSLRHFGVLARIAKTSELPPPRSSKLRYILWRQFGHNPRFVRERGLAVNRNLLTLGPGCYLHGYFQSEEYFSDIAHSLRQELRIITPPNELNAALLERISRENAVSLHVRRGDYLTQGSGVFATCGKAYYDSAIAYVTELAGPPTIYVFSDDPHWAREHLDFRFPMVISDQNHGRLDYEDLRLISSCRHNIVANSTFSWWGAWLNPNPDKIVVAPRVWFTSGSADNPDIVPSGWHRMKN